MAPDKHDYDQLYAAPTPPPWDIGEPQPELFAVAERIPPRDPVLDAGCGTGRLAIALARMGHRVHGIDASIKGIAVAQRNAVREGVDVQFDVVDATRLDRYDLRPRTVFDSGLLHGLDDAQRRAYVDGLEAICPPDSIVYVLAMSIEAGMGWGMTSHDLEQPFATEAWTDIVVEPALILARPEKEKIRLAAHLLSARRT